MTSSKAMRGVVIGAALAVAAGAVVGRLVSHGTDARGPGPGAVALATKSVESASKPFQIPVTSSQPSRGPADALVTVIEWSDIRCERCAASEAALEAAVRKHADAVRVVWRSRFQESVPDSLAAIDFAMEAHTQAGKFWEALKLLRAHQEPLSEDVLSGVGKQLGLDATGLKQALEQQSHRAHIVNDAIFAERFGVRDIPAFFIDGVPFKGPQTAEGFEAAISPELARAQRLVETGVKKDMVYAELTKDGLWNVPDWKPPQSAQ